MIGSYHYNLFALSGFILIFASYASF